MSGNQIDYTLENQTVTLCEDLQILHYLLTDLEEYDNYTEAHKEETRYRVQTLCYRLEKDLTEVKENIEKYYEKRG